ncbi:hypothetical protein VISI1226_03965 [Vibrio sinaloensis DSM 21326]|uniref:Uncharacterized protein n=1 Tax=Vibrio sinaloensis DSM 21326 TaxID=945550 RepID=E8MCJ9_PHOS4|nr:hypothetical protein [Vibrio sinaloensis]EGA68242.1 hypothetical protein VISI1226_03965 [Vibrio sinaloensis DSM 21326]
MYIALYDFATPKPPIKFQPDKVTFSVNLKQDNLPALSENADYPSPVIQLQQVLSNTYVEEEKVEFPLIDEKLINLSSHSSSSNTQVPEELALLKERINRLQRSE